MPPGDRSRTSGAGGDPTPEDAAQSRHAGPVPPTSSTPAKHCWAFIVGVSNYHYADGKQLSNLRFATHDAKAFAKQVQRPSCGNVDPATRMTILLDKEATRERILEELRTFVRRPAKGDLVILYFACHGTPDPEPRYSKVVYLVAHDTDVARIGLTGVRMRTIQSYIADYLQEQRVLLIADTCHSGALVQPPPGRRGPNDEAARERAAVVGEFFREVGRSGVGTSVLASAGERQGAWEGKVAAPSAQNMCHHIPIPQPPFHQ